MATCLAAVQYVKQKQLVPQDAAVDATELSEGSINYMFFLSSAAVGSKLRTSLLLKHAPPYVKSLGEGAFPLSQVGGDAWRKPRSWREGTVTLP